jgi:hypothetical protein
VSAHEQRHVGTYDLEVGLIGEPFLQGPQFGFDVWIASRGRPVDGAAKTLRAEVSDAGVAEPLFLLELGDGGRYQALFDPPVESTYLFHLVGTIDGQPIDETFEYYLLPASRLGIAGVQPQGGSVSEPVEPVVLLAALAVGVGLVIARRRVSAGASVEPQSHLNRDASLPAAPRRR